MQLHEHPNIICGNDTKLAQGQKRRRRFTATTIFAFIGIFLLVLAGPAVTLEPAQAQGDCERKGMNGMCKPWGEIWMKNNEQMRGEPVDLTSEIYLTSDFKDMGARWVMFSVRNVTWDGSDPVQVQINGFGTQHGSIITTREDYESNQVDLWVDVMDLPVNEKIEIDMTIGSSERGAFMIESMVIVFDRGYEEIQDRYGRNVALFAATHLGVNEASGEGSSGGLTSKLQNIPGAPVVAVVGVIALAAVVVSRRRDS